MRIFIYKQMYSGVLQMNVTTKKLFTVAAADKTERTIH